MPISPVTVPKYPNVPRAPGVPPVVRNPSPGPLAIANDITLLVADLQLIFSLFGPPQWGIYDSSGQRVLFPDSIYAVDYRQDSDISDYPLEQGAFASYNKVATPFGVKVTMTKGGSDAEREAFLTDVAIVASSLDLYDVVMPDVTLSSVNVSHVDYRVTAVNGVSLKTVDLWFTEIRETGSAVFQNTAQPSGADPINTGTVQPVAPTFGTVPKPIPVTVTPL